MSTDERQAAQSRLDDLIALTRTLPPGPEVSALLEEEEALKRAIAAFHLEAIRFRIYNVDRRVSHAGLPFPPDAAVIVEDVRRHLEAAGFHTRSH
jgi:hypothetical protein